MILSLLLPALLLGNVELQSSNITEDASERTHGFSVPTTHPATMRRDKGTTTLNEEEKTQLEEALKNNQTSSSLMEDDEAFQDPVHQDHPDHPLPAPHCDPALLVALSHTYCGESFHVAMETVASDWPYNDLTVCLENLSPLVGCYFPNPHIQDFFLHIHDLYFEQCRSEAVLLEDAPYGLVVALTLLAVSFIPVLLYLLLWKNNLDA